MPARSTVLVSALLPTQSAASAAAFDCEAGQLLRAKDPVPLRR